MLMTRHPLFKLRPEYFTACSIKHSFLRGCITRQLSLDRLHFQASGPCYSKVKIATTTTSSPSTSTSVLLQRLLARPCALTDPRCSLHHKQISYAGEQSKFFSTPRKLTAPSSAQCISNFHTTSRRCIPPVFWLLLKPFVKFGAIISGRSVRKWWQALPNKRRAYFWARMKQKWYYLVFLSAGLGGVAALYYRTHMEETPITGRRRFMAVTHDQFMKIAQAEAGAILIANEDKLLGPNPYYQHLTSMVDRLVQANPEIKQLMGNISWKIYIVDDPQINAFVLPTGHIFVYKGILEFAQNLDQLAVVIAHEMTHALLNHGIEQVSYSQLLDYAIIVCMAAIWCLMPNDGISMVTHWFYNRFIHLMVNMPYSRSLEKEADKVGLQLAARACYDVREGSVFWARMSIKEDINEVVHGEDDKVPEWLSTHPSHEKRVEFFDFLLPKALELREEAKCPVLPSKDPREVIKTMSAIVDEARVAKKTGQNLTHVSAIKASKKA